MSTRSEDEYLELSSSSPVPSGLYASRNIRMIFTATNQGEDIEPRLIDSPIFQQCDRVRFHIQTRSSESRGLDHRKRTSSSRKAQGLNFARRKDKFSPLTPAPPVHDFVDLELKRKARESEPLKRNAPANKSVNFRRALVRIIFPSNGESQ